MFVIYANETEIIVTTKDREEEALKIFFARHTKRNIVEFTRIERNDEAVWIQMG